MSASDEILRQMAESDNVTMRFRGVVALFLRRLLTGDLEGALILEDDLTDRLMADLDAADLRTFIGADLRAFLDDWAERGRRERAGV